jgi:poly-gamma-glutamate capsule biosynthesis protein CapA/YwtB (metallophosphatase superfamily)
MSPPGVTLFLCGDVMTGRGLDQILEHPGDPRLYESWADIDRCVPANNHVLDWSYPGLEQTLSSLQGAGLGVTGAGSDATAATRPALIQVKPGCRVVVVALGTPSSGIPPTWAAGSDPPGVALAQALSSAEVDAVVVLPAVGDDADWILRRFRYACRGIGIEVSIRDGRPVVRWSFVDGQATSRRLRSQRVSVTLV